MDKMWSVLLLCVLWSVAQCKTCTYGNMLYTPGPVKLSPCVECMCSEETGELTCAHMSCPPTDDPGCISYEVPPGECCPICYQRGCHYNGEGYLRGEKIHLGPCHYCYCPWEGPGAARGEVSCFNVTCTDMGCQGAIQLPGKCCPVCPGSRFDEWTYQMGYDDNLVPYTDAE